MNETLIYKCVITSKRNDVENTSFLSALTGKPNTSMLMQMYKIIEQMYTVSLAYGLPDAGQLLLFSDLLLIERKLRLNSGRKLKRLVPTLWQTL